LILLLWCHYVSGIIKEKIWKYFCYNLPTEKEYVTFSRICKMNNSLDISDDES
jgi:hypothetical protein